MAVPEAPVFGQQHATDLLDRFDDIGCGLPAAGMCCILRDWLHHDGNVARRLLVRAPWAGCCPQLLYASVAPDREHERGWGERRLGEKVTEDDLLKPGASQAFRCAATQLAAAVVAAAARDTAGLEVARR